jgi:hypothetical protein
VLGLRGRCRELHERRPPILLRLRRYIILTPSALSLLNILIPQKLSPHLVPVVARTTCSSKLCCSLSSGRSSSLQAPSHQDQTPAPGSPERSTSYSSTLALAPIKASAALFHSSTSPRLSRQTTRTLLSFSDFLTPTQSALDLQAHDTQTIVPRTEPQLSNVAQPASI